MKCSTSNCQVKSDSVKNDEVIDVKKSITSSFFNRITLHLAARCRTFQKINV